MAARLAVLAAAALLAGFGVSSLRDTRACRLAGNGLLLYALSDAPLLDVSDFERECRGARTLALTARALAEHDRLDEATRLANEAIRREPGNYQGWAALVAVLERRGLPEAAARARREAVRLNPRFGIPG